MTGKELMYVDDALGHLTHFKTLCDDYTKKIKDPSLKAFVKDLSKQTETMKMRFMNILGGNEYNE